MKVAQAAGMHPPRDIEVSESVRSSRLQLNQSSLNAGKEAESKNEKEVDA